MRIGIIPFEWEKFYLSEVSREYPKINIEEYQLNFNKKNYDALINISSNQIKDFNPLFIAKNAIQRKNLEYFESLGIISDRAFFKVKVNDANFGNHPIRCFQETDDVKFRREIIPMEIKNGIVCFYGCFEDENIFNRCVNLLRDKKGINVQEDDCTSWTVDQADLLDSIPNIFDALEINSESKRVLIEALLGIFSSRMYLKEDINTLKTLFGDITKKEREIINNERVKDTLSSAGVATLIEFIKHFLLN